MITSKQQSFIESLLKDRAPDDGLRADATLAIMGGVTKQQASGIIERLLNAPRSGKPQAEASNAEAYVAGRYALPSDFDPEGTPVFYKVDDGRGKWHGYRFLSKLVGPNEERIKDRAERERILGLIGADPEGCLRRYGNLSGSCGCCGLDLTDKFSRFMGVGPVCREKVGMAKSAADFVAKGGQLSAEYLREVAAEEEAARAEDDAATAGAWHAFAAES